MRDLSPDQTPRAGVAPEKFFVLAGASAVAWIIFQLGGMTGHVFSATKFILGDQGSYLYAIGRSQAGEALYRDFAWQYGPLALGWGRAFAALGGNTPLMLVLGSSVAFAIAWTLLARLLVRGAGWGWGGGLALISLLVMSASGPGWLNGTHGAVEMLLLVGCAWILAAEKQGPGRPWQLGLLAGLLHWVRFGPQAAALAAILVITAWQAWTDAPDGRAFVRQLTTFAARLLTAYALTIVPLVIWILRALPWPDARDQLWPAHMVAHYAVTYPNRWPQISSPAEFAVTWLPAVMGVALVLWVLASRWKRRAAGETPRSRTVAGLLFLPLNYLICCAVLFHNDNPIIGHLWMTWPGLALAARVKARPVRIGLAALLLPAVVGIAVTQWGMKTEEEAWQAQALTLPNGQQLWFHAGEAKRFRELQVALGPDSPRRKMAVFLAGGGIHYFFGPQRVGRHWWFLPEFVRPYEEETVLADLLRSDLILVADRGQTVEAFRETSGPSSTVLWLPLSRPLATRLQPHLRNPRYLEGIGILLRVEP